VDRDYLNLVRPVGDLRAFLAQLKAKSLAEVIDIFALVSADGLRLGAVGRGSGTCGAFELTRLLAGMLYVVTPRCSSRA